MDIDALLKLALEQNASDLHLLAGTSPALRIDGRIVSMEGTLGPVLTTEKMVDSLLNDQQKEEFARCRHLGFSFSLEGLGRFRGEVFYNRGRKSAAIRLWAGEMMALENLGLPAVVENLCRNPHGLILVTGPTGVGKTSTLSAMVDLINRERSCKITTIEDPIEFVHENKRSIVVQQEVNDDTPSFALALVHVLRQDPDVVVVGEMRSLETIQTTLTAAETGHLVLATLHTNSAAQTIERVIDVFPPHQQHQVRIQLAGTLLAIISQRLLPRIDDEGRVLAYEVLVNTPAVKNVIRESKTQQLQSIMQAGGGMGMCTMDSTIERLYHSGQISYDVAADLVTNRQSLRSNR
jgi:twitching motility protein PilT